MHFSQTAIGESEVDVGLGKPAPTRLGEHGVGRCQRPRSLGRARRCACSLGHAWVVGGNCLVQESQQKCPARVAVSINEVAETGDPLAAAQPISNGARCLARLTDLGEHRLGAE